MKKLSLELVAAGNPFMVNFQELELLSPVKRYQSNRFVALDLSRNFRLSSCALALVFSAS
jgi:hypothetical protein